MAASTISHNTPAVGSITWTAFNIAYNGVGYAVPAGSTAGRFVWWEYRSGTPAVMTGDVLPELTADDTVLFLNKGGIGQLLPETTVVDGSLIVEESILASAIGAEQINGGHIEADSVQAKHLAAGSVTADALSVGTVSSNLVSNGSFEDYNTDGTIVGWEVSAMTNGTIQPVTGVASSGRVAIQFAPSTTTANLRLRQTSEKFIPVSSASGRRWYVSARMGVAGTSTTNGAYLRVNWYDGNRAYLSYTDIRSNGSLSTTFAVYEGQVTPPSTARFLGVELLIVSPSITSNTYVDEVTVHEVLVAAHIADGQISTPKLAAQAVTADKILISDWTNYWSNPDFEGDGSGASPRGMTSATTHRVKDISGMNTGNGSNRALEIDARSGANNDVYDLNTFAVKPGDQFYVRFQGRHLNTVGTGATGLGFRSYDAKKVAVTWARVADFGARKTTAWEEIEGVYTVPAGTYFLQPWATFANNAETTNKFYVDNVVIRRMAGGELIVDGAIDGMVITGATIQTAKEGARIVLDETGLKGWDANNINYLKADSTGLQVTGTLAAIGPGVNYDEFVMGQYGERDVEVSIGGATGVVGVQTQQWPPPPPSTHGEKIPGIAFKPLDEPMYDYASMTSRDGIYVELQSGITMAEYDAWKADLNNAGSYLIPSSMSLAKDGAHFSKIVSAEGYKIGGQDLSAGEVHVWDTSGTMLSARIPVPRLGILRTNYGLSTSSDLGYHNDSEPGTLRVYRDGIYDIEFQYSQTGGNSGARSFIEIKLEGSDMILGRASFNPNEDSVNCSVSGIKLAAEAKLIFEVYQSEGGTDKPSKGRVRIKRVAAPVPVAAWGEGDQSVTGNVTAGGIVSGKHRRWEGTTTNFHVAAYALWDSGPVTMTTAPERTTDSGMCTAGPYAGAITFNESGYYMVSLFVVPRNVPGDGWTALNYIKPDGSVEKLAQVGNRNYVVHETYLSLVPTYFAAGSYIRSQMYYSAAHEVDATWKVVKVAT